MKKYKDAYFKSLNLDNKMQALEHLKRLQGLFSDKYSNEKSEEFRLASNARNDLETKMGGGFFR